MKMMHNSYNTFLNKGGLKLAEFIYTMNNFQGTKVCLVLSCDRPYYKQRRETNYHTYKWFQQNGFSVVFLFAGTLSDEPELSVNSDGTYTLRVPSLEAYELLSHKMELAYKFFSRSGCTGILKIDDDIRIKNSDKLKTFLNELETAPYDYIGITIGHFKSDGNLAPYMQKYKLNLFKTLQIAKADIVYAGGPFYWVSQTTINHIANDGLEYIYEDVSVGNVVKNHPELTRSICNTLFKNVIEWNDERES